MFRQFALDEYHSLHLISTVDGAANICYNSEDADKDGCCRIYAFVEDGLRIHRPDHNLDHTRTQFKLVADMNRKWDEMMKIIREETPRLH